MKSRNSRKETKNLAKAVLVRSVVEDNSTTMFYLISKMGNTMMATKNQSQISYGSKK